MIRIGILGGIGPEATGEYYNKLINELQRRGHIKTNADYPQIIINSIPAPELVNGNITLEELEPYKKGLKELDNINVQFIVMVCNTIHLRLKELQASIKTPILDLRKAMYNYLKEKNIQKITVLGTPMTSNKGLYAYEDIIDIPMSNEEKQKMSEDIFAYNKGDNKEEITKEVKELAQKYQEKGAETVILGCTEVGVMLKGQNIKTANSIDILVDATIKKLLELKNT